MSEDRNYKRVQGFPYIVVFIWSFLALAKAAFETMRFAMLEDTIDWKKRSNSA